MNCLNSSISLHSSTFLFLFCLVLFVFFCNLFYFLASANNSYNTNATCNTNVPVKSRLKHPRGIPRAFDVLSCPRGREFDEVCLPRGGAFDYYS